jgi:hypothetical protein
MIFQTFYQHSLGDHSYMPLAKITNVIIVPKLLAKHLFFFHYQDASMVVKTITISCIHGRENHYHFSALHFTSHLMKAF